MLRDLVRFGGGEAVGVVVGFDDVAAECESVSDARALQISHLERTYPGPFAHTTGDNQLQVRLADLLTHGWDLGRATGQPAELPVDLVENALAFVKNLAGAFARSGKFGTPQPVSADAPALDRLAALCGRPVG